jgi:hypothetical protein
LVSRLVLAPHRILTVKRRSYWLRGGIATCAVPLQLRIDTAVL